MIKLQNFLGNFPLKRGAVMIGIFKVFWGILNLISFYIYLTFARFSGVAHSGVALENAMLIVDLFFYIMIIISGVLIVKGVLIQNRKNFLPWLATGLLEIASYTFFMGVRLFEITVKGENGITNILDMMVNFIMAIATFYMWICIYSLYKSMKLIDGETPPTVDLPTTKTSSNENKGSDKIAGSTV